MAMAAPFRVKFTAQCELADPNNGIVKSTFTRRGPEQDEIVHVNTLRWRGAPMLGMTYWIEIYPAFPTDDARNQKTRARIKSERRYASPRKSGRDKMQKKYQGKPVTASRDAVAGDPGFDATKDQVVITVDGQPKTVLRSEVTDVQ